MALAKEEGYDKEAAEPRWRPVRHPPVLGKMTPTIDTGAAWRALSVPKDTELLLAATRVREPSPARAAVGGGVCAVFRTCDLLDICVKVFTD